MLSSADRQDTASRDPSVIEPDVVISARTDKEAPSLAPDVRPVDRQPGAAAGAAPTVNAGFRASADAPASPAKPAPPKEGRSAFAKWTMRVVVVFFLALTSALVAGLWERYGDTPRDKLQELASNWSLPSLPHVSMPSLPDWMRRLTSSSPADQSGSTEQTGSVDATAPAPAADRAEAQAVAAPVAEATSSSAESAPVPQSVARDLAAMSQEIAGLKASIEQLRAGQAQLSRDMARASEARSADVRAPDMRPADAAALHPHIALPPPRPPAAPARKPRPAQTAAAPVARAPQPMRLDSAAPAPADGVVRPPLPVR